MRSPFNINSLAQAAAAAAIGDEAHREASRAMNEEGKRFLYGKLKELGVPYLPTQANFIFAKMCIRDSPPDPPVGVLAV